jgi:drug/metabolite transporter (DMT)-like permease
MNDLQFESVRDAWRSAPVDSVKLDFSAKLRRARWTVFGEVVALLWIAAFSAFFLSRDARPVTVVLCVFVIIFVVTSVAYGWIQRLRLMDRLSTATLTFAMSLQEHHQLEVRLHKVGRVGIWITAVFCLLWVPWKLVEDWGAYLEHPWSAIVGIAGIVLILAGVVVSDIRTARRLQREGARLQQLLASLQSDPEA